MQKLYKMMTYGCGGVPGPGGRATLGRDRRPFQLLKAGGIADPQVIECLRFTCMPTS